MDFVLYDKEISEKITSHATVRLDELVQVLKENQSSGIHPTFELTYIRKNHA